LADPMCSDHSYARAAEKGLFSETPDSPGRDDSHARRGQRSWWRRFFGFE
jgi:hypothetical protein